MKHKLDLTAYTLATMASISFIFGVVILTTEGNV